MLSENDKLTRVLRIRNQLIDDLDEKKISKSEFLDRNYHLLCRMQMKPFLRIDTLEKGLYNYQYYNTMAKQYAKSKCRAQTPKRRKIYEDAEKNYYHLKDQCILSLLQIASGESIEAYPVFAESAGLREKLIEIVFTAQEKMILHTLNPEVLRELCRLGVYCPEIKRSKIHSYINEREEESQ